MAGNSWQQPVAGEPSAGSLHWRWTQLYNGDPGSTNWTPIDLSSYIPNGATLVSLTGTMQETGGSAYILQVSTASAGTAYIYKQVSFSGVEDFHGILPVTSSKTIYWQVNNAGVDNVTINMQGYYI